MSHKTEELLTKSVDALLATTCSRLLNAGALVNGMREAHRVGNMSLYAQFSADATEHLVVAAHAITEAHHILMAKQGIAVQQQGGLIH